MHKKQTPSKIIASSAFICFLLLNLPGCQKQPSSPGMISRPRKERKEIIDRVGELDFLVKNNTGQKIFVTCFYYAKKATGYRWRWYKSPIYELTHNQRAFIDIDTIPEEQHKKNVYGYLAVFKDQTEAETAIYELLEDEKRIDLGPLVDIHDKMIVIEYDQYGFKGAQLDFTIKKQPAVLADLVVPEIDFLVENRTGENLWVTCFVYQKTTKYHQQWDFIKTPVLRLNIGQTIMIDIESIAKEYDHKNIRGYLAVFKDNEKDIAESTTYELISQHNNLKLDKLYKLKGKKVVISKHKYGLEVDRFYEPHTGFLEFSIESTKNR